MLTLHTANRYEDLRDRLLDHLALSPLPDPFAARQIIVPSMAIKRDLQLAISRRQGVCTRVEFPFLAQWLWNCFGQLVDVPEVSPFAPQRLTWRLFRIFGDRTFVASQPRLQHFLQHADPVMQLELAQRVAGLFEQIVTYRPEWLEAWREGKTAKLPTGAPRQDELWQAALWRRITHELGTARQHPATAFLHTLESLGEEGIQAAKLPSSVDIFALPTLPPQYLRVLHALANSTSTGSPARINIRLYQLNPCAEFWFDVVDTKQLARLRANAKHDFHDVGNALLAGWGKQTQSQFSLLFDSDTLVEASADVVEHPNDTLLGQIQNAILQLQETPATTAAHAADRSLEIHVCHSLSRELEVLHDRLLSLRSQLPDLRADQILVAVPDLEAAVPAIEAVFGSRSGLPFHITGRSESTQNRVARSLLSVLDAATSRLPASEGIALLRNPLIARRFQLDEQDVESLVDALHTAGLHWGLGDGKYTWRDALGRLLLGYAAGTPNTPDASTPFLGQLPAGAGGSGQLLGLLWRFLEALEQLHQRMKHALSAKDWLIVWQTALDSLLAPADEQLEEARQVRQLIATLSTEMAEGDSTTTFPAEIARTALMHALEAAPRGGIPSGAITFAALSSLRGLPFRIICVLGLNDGVFPSPQRPLEFDLLSNDYRPGDRQRRLDERNLFLDLLLSARETLHLSYTGRSQRDDSPMPPSVLISELLDHLRPAIGKAGIERLQVRHPLQAFSPRYQDAESDVRLTTYQTTLPPSGNPANAEITPFFTAPLPPVNGTGDTHWLTPSLSDLKAFFRHPARTLLRDRLGIRLQEGLADIDDEEPLLMGLPDTWPLLERLLPISLATENAQATGRDLEALALAGVEVPTGAVGLAQVRPLLENLQQFATTLRSRGESHSAPLPLAQIALFTEVDGTTLAAQLQLRDIHPTGLLRYRYSPLSAGDYIAAWLDHLALCLLAPPHVTRRTEHFGRDASGNVVSFAYVPVDDPSERLRDWIRAYWHGLHAPLMFPPKTAWALKQDSESAAQTAWFNRYQARGESLDPWWQLALRGTIRQGQSVFSSPLAKELQQWSDALLEPLIAHLAPQFTPQLANQEGVA